MISQCLGAAHQYLSKPCDPELLKTLITETCRPRSALPSDRVKEVVGRIQCLPSLPIVFQALSKALASERTSSTELGEIIAQDIGMTAKILKLVNSAFFGLRRELTSPTEAVTYLGFETVRSLVLANSIFNEAKPLETKRLSIDLLWSHSMCVAHASRAVAKLLDPREKTLEQAFTSGILHDSGILILASSFPEPYDEVLELSDREHLQVTLAEQRIFGVNHAEVGAYLMNLWGLPPAVVQCIRHHHAPSSAENPELVSLKAVHLADALISNMSAKTMFEHGVLDPILGARPEIEKRMPEFRAVVKDSLFIPPIEP
jgi:HD-like signal output (HDOD) protein